MTKRRPTTEDRRMKKRAGEGRRRSAWQEEAGFLGGGEGWENVV